MAGFGIDQAQMMQIAAARGGWGAGGLAMAGKGWNLLKKIGPDEVNIAANVAEALIPSVETRAFCRVYGNPASKRRDLFKLACSIVFGLVRKRKRQGLGAALPPAATMVANFDMVKKIVTIQVSYRTSALGNVLNGLGGQAAAQINQGDKIADALVVFGNIDDDVVGDKFSHLNFLERRILGGVPALPGEGKTLLSDDPSIESPAPPGDRIGRGGKTLEGLIWESILNPPAMIPHPELKEVAPNDKTPGSPGAYTPAKGTAPNPKANIPLPAWKAFWLQRGLPTQPGAG